MSHLETELHLLKEDLIEMTRLVKIQLFKGRDALLNFDRDLAREILVNENRVNALELKIDSDCENIFALFNPVAVDLRFVLAALKINANLERIGDNAEGIARYVLDVETPFNHAMLAEYRIPDMYATATSMLDDTLSALLQEDTKLARQVFLKDDYLDEINKECTRTTLKLLKDHPENAMHYLSIMSIIRKLERVGDQSKNIAEEIIFFIEAKVLKHTEENDNYKSL
jgi:phosphate transport system protein